MMGSLREWIRWVRSTLRVGQAPQPSVNRYSGRDQGGVPYLLTIQSHSKQEFVGDQQTMNQFFPSNSVPIAGPLHDGFDSDQKVRGRFKLDVRGGSTQDS